MAGSASHSRSLACAPSRPVIDMRPVLIESHRSRVPIHDTLMIAELIQWKTGQLYAEAALLSGSKELSKDEIDQHFTKCALELYVFCGRLFVIQLLHCSVRNRFDALVGREQFLSIFGSARFLHHEICRCDDGRFENTLSIRDILDVCLQQIGAEFDKYCAEKDANDPRYFRYMSNDRYLNHMSRFAEKNAADEDELERPSEKVASKIKADIAKQNLVKGSDSESHNYRSAYCMMVGLDSSIRLKKAMALYRLCLCGVGAFASEMKSELLAKGYHVFADAALRKTFAEAQMSSECVLVCMSAITLKFDLPSSGSSFSRKHLLGDDEALWLEEYAPALFAECRQAFNISGESYKRSVARTGFSFIEFASNSKSGQMFFFSWDSKYLIKTITEKEAFVLLRMLPKYVQHITKPSLLMRICGLYRVSVSADQSPRFFSIALSVFDTGPEKGLHHQFDLKGSTRGRVAGEQEEVKKDLNWIKDGFQVNLPTGLKRKITSALENDANFLKEQNVLDYSVLVGIHDRKSKEPGVQSKGVRLLQGILKQKITPQTANRGQSESPVTESRNGHMQGAASAAEFGCNDKRLHTRAHSMGNTSEPNGELAWKRRSRCPSATSSSSENALSVSRLPSCMSDPYEESELDVMEDHFFVEDDFDSVYPPVDMDQEEWKRLSNWLPRLDESLAFTASTAGEAVDTGAMLSSHHFPAVEEGSEIPSTITRSRGSFRGTAERDTNAGEYVPSPAPSPVDVDSLASQLDELSKLNTLEAASGISSDLRTIGDVEKERQREAGKRFVPLNLGSSPRVVPLYASQSPTLPGIQSGEQGTWLQSGNGSEAFQARLRSKTRYLRASSLPWTTKIEGPAAKRGNIGMGRPSLPQKLMIHRCSDDDRVAGWDGTHGPICATSAGEHGRFEYYIGIIDFLIPWDSKKKVEYALNYVRGNARSASCVPPDVYAKRQIDFVLHSVMGLLSPHSACAYAHANVTIPPPNLLRDSTEEKEESEAFAGTATQNSNSVQVEARSVTKHETDQTEQTRQGSVEAESTLMGTPTVMRSHSVVVGTVDREDLTFANGEILQGSSSDTLSVLRSSSDSTHQHRKRDFSRNERFGKTWIVKDKDGLVHPQFRSFKRVQKTAKDRMKESMYRSNSFADLGLAREISDFSSWESSFGLVPTSGSAQQSDPAVEERRRKSEPQRSNRSAMSTKAILEDEDSQENIGVKSQVRPRSPPERPGGPEPDGIAASRLYSWPESMSEHDGNALTRVAPVLRPSTPRNFEAPLMRQKPKSELELAQMETEMLSSQLDTLMATLETAKTSAAIAASVAAQGASPDI